MAYLLGMQAAGLKHIGFGPFKRENQDEFFIQVRGYSVHRVGSTIGARVRWFLSVINCRRKLRQRQRS